jgi:hypothetical protein
MSLWTGKHAVIKKNGVVVTQCTNWKLDVNSALLDATSQNTDWKTQGAGINDWKGSFELIFDTGITEHLAIQAAIVAATGATMLTDMIFYVDGAGAHKSYSGNVWINTISYSAPVNDLVKAAVTFTGDGALTFTA